MEAILTKNISKPNSHTLSVYQESGGYEALKKALSMERGDILEEIKTSGLRGRGGAGFPAGLKMSFMPKEKKGAHYLCCNADESEPGTFKDIVLTSKDPHMVIEGCMIAAFAIQADAVWFYIRGEFWDGAKIMSAAVEEAYKANLVGKNILGSGWDCEFYVYRGAGAYICGEESALMESVEGKRGHPRLKPPFPAQSGVYGKPTTINNVETLANIPYIITNGGKAFAEIGTDERNTGTKLYCISGQVKTPGVYEHAIGYPLKDLIYKDAGGLRDGRKLKCVIPGGSSSPFLKADEIDIKMDYDSVAKAGSMLGSAATMVVDDSVCIVDLCVNISQFYHHESCGQCTPCREGCGWLQKILTRIEAGEGQASDLALLEDIFINIRGRTICAFGDAAVMPIASALEKFRSEFEAHIEQGSCPMKK